MIEYPTPIEFIHGQIRLDASDKEFDKWQRFQENAEQGYFDPDDPMVYEYAKQLAYFIIFNTRPENK